MELREEQPETGDFSAYDNPDIDCEIVYWSSCSLFSWCNRVEITCTHNLTTGARTAYVQPQSMIHDRYLYDRTTDSW